jgi:AAA ATPase containing von Willebrand factor type A (vWA) domain
MKKILVVFAVFAALIFIVSCGGGSSKPADGGESEKNAGELGGECYPNKSCNEGLICDEENNVCIEDPENPADDSDSEEPETDEDIVDTDPTEPTNPTTDPTPDEDADTSETEPDEDADSTPVSDDDIDTPEPNDEDSDTIPTPDEDTDTTPVSDEDADTIVEPLKEGIYFGIIGFNETLPYPQKAIGLLNTDSESSYKSFINSLTSADGTSLYFADYTALEMMRDYSPVPPKLKNVALVTFTDGLDNISLANDDYNPENYGSHAAYREALHNMIVDAEGIHGVPVAAYTIGLKGKDVTDTTAFEETLEKLASEPKADYVFQVSDMDEVKEHFNEIAEALYSVSKTVNLKVKVPGGYDDGQHLRFTFDNPSAATSSNLYIEATFRRSGGRTLDEISYHGFADGETTISSVSSQGAYYFFVFEELKYDGTDTPISDADLNRIMLWKETTNGGWDKESEFNPTSSSTVTEDKNSALIMLVLDCTTSLGTDFGRMKQAGKDFVTTLVHGGSGATTTPCNPNPCTSISNSTGVCTVNGSGYTCGCQSGYAWSSGSCTSSSTPDNLTLGNICTGQTSCYNASSSMTCPSSSSADFYGQDAQYTSECTAQSFSASSNVVVDNNTGLTWEKSPSTDTYTWDNRDIHCNELNNSNYGGKSNWRVPNPLELLTIVNNSTSNPATNSNFTGMPTSDSTYLWTNNEYKGGTSNAYYFSPSYGWYWYDGTKTNTYKVLCVSGEEMKPAVSSDFTTSSDGKTVTDNRTGLMWQKEYATGKTWQQALKYCEDSTYAGYSDWRLPNKNELASLLDPGKSSAPYSNFPDMPSDWFWSSSTYVFNTDFAWGVPFYYGNVSYRNKTYNGYVRCVR